MSYLYYPYYPYYSIASQIAVEGALRRSRLAELAISRAATESALRRSRIEAEVATENALRRSRIQAEVAAESALRRSRVAAQIQADRLATEAALRRSRVEAQIAAGRIATENALRRSRIEADIAADSALRRSRLAAEIQASRIRRLHPFIRKYLQIEYLSLANNNQHIGCLLSKNQDRPKFNEFLTYIKQNRNQLRKFRGLAEERFKLNKIQICNLNNWILKSMFKNNVYTFRNFPVEDQQRKWTDCICTIIGAAFSLTLFILACCLFTKSNFYMTNYPVDDTGASCYYNQTDAPFIYFQNLNDLTTGKHCLSVCPNQGDGLQCSTSHPCPGLVSSYNSSQVINELGGFCLPTDSDLQNKFWRNPIIASKQYLINGYSSILHAFIIGVCLGIIYTVFFVLFPKLLTFGAFFLAFLSLLAAGILLIIQPLNLLDQQSNVWNTFFGIITLIVAIFFLVFLLLHRQQIQVGSIFMSYSNQFIKQTPRMLGYIALFILLSVGLVVLVIWQYIAFGTSNPAYLKPGDLFFTSGQNLLLQFLNVVEFIWGIQFLRDSFNYIISGNTVQWYFTYNNNAKAQIWRPFKRLFLNNFGSVVGGSFLNAFFNLFGILYDLFRCDPRGTCGKVFKCCEHNCCCFSCLFDLVRADTYAYIHLSGIPYCNAARQCQGLCEKSHLFSSNHSCIRLYRIAAQVFLVCLTVIITIIILSARTDYASFIIVGVIILTSYIAVTYFADIHSNGAQGLVICYLAERNCEGNYLQVCPLNLRNEIYEFEQKYELTQF